MKFILFHLCALGLLFCTEICASAAPPARIVSLAPSLTEILYSFGLERNIVGVTISCDRPPEARRKPKVGGMANPSIEAVIALRPDVVVMTREGNPKAFAERLVKFHIRTVVFRARRLRELSPEIRRLGRALGAEREAENLARVIESSIDRLAAPAPARSSRSVISKKRALFIISPEQLIAAGPGTIIDDVMTLLGLENVTAGSPAPYPPISLETVIRRNPEIIFIGAAPGMNEGHATRLLKRLSNVDAVRKGRVYYMSDALYRPGPRIPMGIKELRVFIDTLP
jgi:iron complex transport system substrate-binding protein